MWPFFKKKLCLRATFSFFSRPTWGISGAKKISHSKKSRQSPPPLSDTPSAMVGHDRLPRTRTHLTGRRSCSAAPQAHVSGPSRSDASPPPCGRNAASLHPHSRCGHGVREGRGMVTPLEANVLKVHFPFMAHSCIPYWLTSQGRQSWWVLQETCVTVRVILSDPSVLVQVRDDQRLVVKRLLPPGPHCKGSIYSVCPIHWYNRAHYKWTTFGTNSV